mmetsp:Transcript_11596/g.16661  ORF Transcript_11596/g.16661 Transcript_11596/m.16661 type:complete len:233 (-) Transcript_11596:1572-2270(-)
MVKDSSSILQEYGDQLIQIQKLLAEDPNNEEYLQLQKDLIELITITTKERSSVSEASISDSTVGKCGEEKNRSAEEEEEKKTEMVFPLSKSSQCHTALEVLPSEDSTIAVSTDDNKASKKKPTTTISENFQVPSHLIPLESDTAAEQNRKRRTIKALKRQHKEKVKEVHATSKQQSWQQFSNKVSNKKGTTKTSSIWRTSETRGVGIVSAATADGGIIDESRSSSNKRLKSG